MIILEPSDFSNDKAFSLLASFIMDNHSVPTSTKKKLNAIGDPDVCVQSRHFAEIEFDRQSFWIHYDVSHWEKTRNLISMLDRLCVYSTFEEYSMERIKSLHSSGSNDFCELN